MSRAKLAILISGRGSNMLAIARACRHNEIAADVELVLSNRPDTAGIEAAHELGIDTAVIDHTQFASREQFDLALNKRLEPVGPDWIVLAGFMRIFSPVFVKRWEGRIVNIHPSLLPLYPGLNTHARAIAAGDREAGASVHLVTSELDAGPVIAQVRVPVKIDDTPDVLASRVIKEEHKLYVDALKQCINSQCNYQQDKK